MDETKIQPIAEWLTGESLKGSSDSVLFQGLCDQLAAAGVPLLRANISYRSLHPLYGGHSYTWWRADELQTTDWERRWGNVGTGDDGFKASPYYHMLATNESRLRYRLNQSNAPLPFPILDELREKGGTDYVGMAMSFEQEGNLQAESGMVSSWTGTGVHGFSSDEVVALERLVPMLALGVKSGSNYRMAQAMLETYLGKDAGRRVLSGQIDRGSITSISAVLWFADLQGFTRMAEVLPQEDLVKLLNEYFDCMVGAVHAEGGQVLKFMGDGLLAFFPLDGGADACGQALRAADAVMAGVSELNASRRAANQPASDFYIALHLGEMMYGNIGSHDRLDFTVIGPAVNEVSRIEAMCRPLDRSLLISSAFAKAAGDCGGRLVSVGRYALRGVQKPQELYTLVPTDA